MHLRDYRRANEWRIAAEGEEEGENREEKGNTLDDAKNTNLCRSWSVDGVRVGAGQENYHLEYEESTCQHFDVNELTQLERPSQSVGLSSSTTSITLELSEQLCGSHKKNTGRELPMKWMQWPHRYDQAGGF